MSTTSKGTCSRSEAVAIARSYIDTPYALGGRVKGGGLDCGTLLAEYLIEIGRADRAELEDLGLYAHDWFCHTSNERYLRGLMRFGALAAETVCRSDAGAQPGDVVLFRCVNSKLFNHGAIVTAWPRGVHACDGKVRESNLAAHRLTGFKQMDVFDPFQEPAAR